MKNNEIIKREHINFSIPAKLVEVPSKTKFTNEENNQLTYCKLYVFYIGETSDKRVFTKEFSDKLLETLPQTPVVAYYDEEEEDFKAHNDKQYVYGYVPENAQIDFEEINGKQYAVTDIVLFTGRKDNIGEVASKILNKKQSLELDPDTVEYKIHVTSDNKLKYIEFIEGKIIGLSVVGDKERPAFEGSEFFTKHPELKNEELINSFLEFANYINQEYDGGVKKVEKNNFKELLDFIKRTYDEKFRALYEAIMKKVDKYIFICQTTDDYVVFADYNDNYYRANYTYDQENNECTIGDLVKVLPRFFTEEEIAIIEEALEKDEEEMQNSQETQEEFISHSIPIGKDTIEIYTKTDTEINILQKQLEQLNNYIAQEKNSILEKYKTYLDNEIYNSFKNKLNDYTEEELKKELAAIAMENIMQQQEQEQTQFNFNTPDIEKEESGDRLEQLIKRYRDNKEVI